MIMNYYILNFILFYFYFILEYNWNIYFIAVQLLEEKLDLISSAGTRINYLESPVSDGTIEENFEEALVDAPVIKSGVWPFIFC